MADRLDTTSTASGTNTDNTKPRARITLPPTAQYPDGKNGFECDGLVIIGANGSGKTRLGVWLETSLGENAHRVAAQKSLEFPPEIRPLDLALAERILRIGDQHGGGIN